MTNDSPVAVSRLIDRLDAAVDLPGVDAITQRIKADLQALVVAADFRLPERFYAARPDCYARRLLYRDPQERYTAVVMTWGPGQSTPIHDHAGIWCVEGVVSGEMDVTQYELIDERDGLYRFEQRGRVRAGVGSAGCLIPPHEYHVLANPRSDGSAITLHVYGGEMDHCHVFTEAPGGVGHERRPRQLSYHD
jgi:predicted metal-dependent enzyme (double-stranded beta helix superfamily)